jgi:hypothetical protein
MTPRILWLATLSAACTPDLTGFFLDATPVTSSDAADVNAAFIDVAASAVEELHVALPALDDPDLTEALIAAYDRGVDVQVVSDAQAAATVGLVALRDAGVPLTLADDDLAFFDFSLNDDVAWTGDQVQMSQSYAVADRARWVNASRAGTTAAGPIAWFEGRGEDIAEVFIAEHNQLMGGTDATSLDAFSATNKSSPDVRWLFPTSSDELMAVHFGPQERLIKMMIDTVYAARSGIRVMSEDISDEGLARALQAKAADGFDVEVVVGATFGQTSPALSEILRSQTPDVPKLQATVDGGLPTVLFVDFEPGRDGFFHRPRVMVLSHPIWSAARLFNGQVVETDQYIDGTLMVLSVSSIAPSEPLAVIADLYNEARATAEEL